MKQFIGILIACTLGFTGCEKSGSTPIPPIMGDLELGTYQVGYKTLFLYDKTRAGLPFSKWSGELYNDHEVSKGRQYQINLWYPAKSGSGDPMKYDHYVHLMGRQTNFNDTESQREFAKQLFIDQTNDLGGDGNFTSQELDTLLNLDVLAKLDASVAPGVFPVVIFPNGSSPAFQSIMSEFLSSHGYVVVAFAPKGRFSSGFEVSTIGIETAVDDMEFILSKVSELSYANMDQVALMANAIASSVCAALVARNAKIKALISLEGGLPSAFEQRLLNNSVFYQPENIAVPLLMIYAPYPSIDPKYIDHLKYAKRHYAHFPQMSEFVMLNYGMFDSMIPNIVGEQKGDTKKGFEVANQLVLKFLNKYIEGDNADLFDQRFAEASKGVIDTTFVKEALPQAPNIAVLKNMFIQSGFQSIDSTYQSLKESGNSQPFSTSFYIDFGRWLGWGEDDSYQFRNKLYQLALESHPQSSLVNYYVAYYAQKLDNKKLAISHYQKALNLLESDNDPLLKSSYPALIRENSTKELLALQ